MMTEELEISPTFTDFEIDDWSLNMTEPDSSFENWQLDCQPEEQIIESEELSTKLLLDSREMQEKGREQFDAQTDSDQWMKNFLGLNDSGLQDQPDIIADLPRSSDVSEKETIDSLPELNCSDDLNFSTNLDSFGVNTQVGLGPLPRFNSMPNIQHLPFNFQPWGMQPVYMLAYPPPQHLNFHNTGLPSQGLSSQSGMPKTAPQGVQSDPNATSASKPSNPLVNLTEPISKLSKIANPMNSKIPSPPRSESMKRSNKFTRPQGQDGLNPSSRPRIVKVINKRKGKFLVEYVCNPDTGDRRRSEWLPPSLHHTIPQHLVREYYQNAWVAIRNKVERGRQAR